ncbi:MAG: Smr/MutS family protein [Gemmatimonadota bacterium]|nr:Smr/MutS family protein [Gemmatimonadota bacterium]
MGKRRVSRPSPEPPRTLHTAVVVDEIDLHGLTAAGAERRLRGFLATHAVRSPDEVVRVITGRGAHSAGSPVVRERVRDALDAALREHVAEWAVDMGGGAYLIRVRG